MSSRRAGPELERLLDEAAEAFDRGDLEAALESSRRACQMDPRSAAALHHRAAAQAELGRVAEARRDYERALEVDPDDLQLLLGAADFHLRWLPEDEPDRTWLTRALELARRGARRAERAGEPELAAELALLEASALRQLGDARGALERLGAAAGADPEVSLERGLALFAELERVAREAPGEALAHHTLGLIAERRGDRREAERRLSRATRLAPDEFPPPAGLAAGAFDAVVEEALRAMPEPVRGYLANVAVAVEDIPAEADLVASDPPLSPSILGVFRGAPLGQKGSMDPWSHFPSSIVLYQRNLERAARDRRELVEEIRATLLHEVGHFLGLDEEELWQRGLD
jgi:predicted Zn-dependent protease with MMP-like domain/Flp pilus assembly protein TadD